MERYINVVQHVASTSQKCRRYLKSAGMMDVEEHKHMKYMINQMKNLAEKTRKLITDFGIPMMIKEGCKVPYIIYL